jgi:hypothetical protein
MWRSIGFRRVAPTLAATLLAFALAAPALRAASPVDGTYAGTSTLTLGEGAQVCGKTFRTSVRVVDGGFDYMWDRQRNVVIPVRIAADGSVSGEHFLSKGIGAAASGRLSGTDLEIEIKGKECARHLSLRKKG